MAASLTLDMLCQELYDNSLSARIRMPLGLSQLAGAELEVQWVEFVAEAGGIKATMRTVTWENGSISDIKEQQVLLASAVACQDLARVRAWAWAYFRALPRLMQKRALAVNPAWLMPRDFLDDAWKLKTPKTEPDFERALLRRYP